MKQHHQPEIELATNVSSGQPKSSARWSEKDETILRRAYKKGGVHEAHAALGGTRTLVAIKLRATKLRLPKRNWSDTEEHEARLLVREGLSLKEISAALGRTESAITQKLKALDSPVATIPKPGRSGSAPQVNGAKPPIIANRGKTHTRRPSVRYTAERVASALLEHGGEFLECPVVDRNSRVLARCPCGTLATKKAVEWVRTPDGCRTCKGKKISEAQDRPRLEQAAMLAKRRGCQLPEQVSPRTVSCKIQWSCELGHVWQASISMIGRGHWCPECRPLLTESMVRSVLQHSLGMPFPKARPSFLDGLELDGFNEKHRLAFEYNGEFHDDERQQGRDLKKRELCARHGVRLITVDYRDGRLGSDGVRIAVERELARLSIQASRSVWDAPAETKGAVIQLQHRKAFEKALTAQGYTWDPSDWRGVDAKVRIIPPAGDLAVLVIPRTFIAGRTPSALAKNAKLDIQLIGRRMDRLGWSLNGPQNYEDAHTILDLIDPWGEPRSMSWNKWQQRYEKSRGVYSGS